MHYLKKCAGSGELSMGLIQFRLAMNILTLGLGSRKAQPMPLHRCEFLTLQGSAATGAQNIGRLTNLMHLNVDTSWFIRYRSATNPEPDVS